MVSKVYVVSSYGGMLGDSWEIIEGVCSTKEIAEALSKKIDSLHKSEISISYKKWSVMYEYLLDYEEAHGDFNSVVEGMTYLYPDIPLNDLEKAYEKYEEDDFIGTNIKEINLFNNLTDI